MLRRMDVDGLGNITTKEQHGLGFFVWKGAPEKDIVKAGFRDAEGNFVYVRNPAPVGLEKLMILAILGMGDGWGQGSVCLGGLLER